MMKKKSSEKKWCKNYFPNKYDINFYGHSLHKIENRVCKKFNQSLGRDDAINVTMKPYKQSITPLKKHPNQLDNDT